MKIAASILAAALAFGTTAAAAPVGDKLVGLSYGTNVGTLGIGSEVIYTRNNSFSVRAIHSGIKGGTSYDFEGTEFDVDGRISSAGVMLDYHPTGETFRISAGARRHRLFKADLSATFDNDFDYRGTSYSEAGPTTIDGRVELREYSPVVTFGWRGDLRENVNINAEFGAMYIGTPDVSLSASGGAADGADAAAFNAEVENHRQSIEDSMSRIGLYPIAQIGISVHF